MPRPARSTSCSPHIRWNIRFSVSSCFCTYGTLQARACIGIAIAVGYLALFRPVSRGAGKLRLVATLVAALAALAAVMAVVDVRDQTPGLLHVFDVAELVCAGLMVVALWLPASSAYAKARRSRGRAE